MAAYWPMSGFLTAYWQRRDGRRGFAHEYTYEAPYKYRDLIQDAERGDRFAGKGLWSEAPHVQALHGDSGKCGASPWPQTPPWEARAGWACGTNAELEVRDPLSACAQRRLVAQACAQVLRRTPLTRGHLATRSTETYMTLQNRPHSLSECLCPIRGESPALTRVRYAESKRIGDRHGET